MGNGNSVDIGISEELNPDVPEQTRNLHSPAVWVMLFFSVELAALAAKEMK